MTRRLLSEDDLTHLLQGGTIQVGDVQLAIDDIGWDRLTEAIEVAQVSGNKFNQIRHLLLTNKNNHNAVSDTINR